MAIEHAGLRAVPKPWGSTDLQPWSSLGTDGVAIGELWFQRPSRRAPDLGLLLKLLFTKQPLSIQVHPDDAFAQSIGLDCGKTEAWYILAAAPGAKIAVGLKRRLAPVELRSAIEDGSIAKLVEWQPVRKHDTVYVPAGTIHAIGAGVVLAEIQQRSDTTFRLFDQGRKRELHVENAVAVAHAGPPEPQPTPLRLSDERMLLVASPYFVLERLELPPSSSWQLDAEQETWILVLEGHARVGVMSAFAGEAIFLEGERASIKVGSEGLTALIAHVGAAPNPGLLRPLEAALIASSVRSIEVQA